MRNKTIVDCLNESFDSPPNPTERTTIFSKKIYEALHGQPQDLPTMVEMLQMLDPLIDTLLISDLEKTLLRHKIATLIEIVGAGGLFEYFNATRAKIRERIGS